MTSIRLPEEMEKKLESLAIMTKRSKSFYIKEALTIYLDDLEDTYISLDRISNPKRELLSSEQVLKEID